MRVVLFIVFACFGLSVDCFADPSLIENTSFKHISTEHGLSQKTVQAIYQDRVGFLWFGTQEGLNRYDGKEIQVYRHSATDSLSLSHDVIRDICEDNQGNLWVATSGGLNRYIASTNNFERVKVLDAGKEIFRFNRLFLDSNNNLWAGSDGNGAFLIRNIGNQIQIEKFNLVDYLNDADIRAIYEDSRGRIWLGSDGNGVTLINQQKITHFIPDETKQGALSHSQVRSIIEDSKGGVWIATRGGGVNRFEELSQTFKVYRNDPSNNKSLGQDRVYQMIEDEFQRIWFATDGGLSVYHPEHDNFTQIHYKSSQISGLNQTRVLSAYQDRRGLLWFGTLSGLNQWDPYLAPFVHYRNISEDSMSLSNNTVYSFAESLNGDVYIGTYGGGLNRLNVKNNTVGRSIDSNGVPVSANRVTSLLVDQSNQIWVGSIPNGVEVYTENYQKVAQYTTDPENAKSLSANGVTSMLQDKSGEIWIATHRAGLNRLTKETNQFKHYRLSNSEGLVSENIYNIIQDDEGFIWLATDGGGISRLDKNTDKIISFIHQPDNPDSLSGNIISFIYQDSKGRFWIGTQGNGLNLWLPGDRRRGLNRFKHYTVETGLESSTINGVLEDDEGFIWVSTNRGLTRLNPENDHLRHYNIADAIHFNELNQGASLKASNGRFYFGGLNGVSAFFPSEIKLRDAPPKTVLTKILSENKPLEYSVPVHQLKEVVFDHNDYLITFEFATLDYAQPEKNRYQYKLAGFDKDWIDLKNLNRATFTNLPSGSYILKIKGTNSDGIWSDQAINLKVTILPAPWVSWWAIALYSLVFCILLLVVIRMQAKRLANQEMFKDMVDEKVSAETALYIKNNEYLKSQVEQIQHKSNYDINSGLPNQNYFMDLVSANLFWINEHFSAQSKPVNNTLQIALLRFLPMTDLNDGQTAGSIDHIIKSFASEIRGQTDNLTLCRWSKNEIGLSFCRSELNGQLEDLRQFIDAQKLDEMGFQPVFVKLSYPLSGVQHDTLNGENVLMLLEHILHLLAEQGKEQAISIVGVNQNISSAKLRQIMLTGDLKELLEVFVTV